jgi:hypothetical protein
VAREVVRVGVGLEDANDPHAAPLGLLEVLLDCVCGVDHDGFARSLVADQIGRAAEVVIHELPKEHVATDGTNVAR